MFSKGLTQAVAVVAALLLCIEGQLLPLGQASRWANDGPHRQRGLRRLAQDEDRPLKLRDNDELPLVWIDVAINGTPIGRMEMVLFARKAPRAVENMRMLCTGELGADRRGKRYRLKGSYFHRIVEDFIDQTGAETDGIYGGDFRDDPGGLEMSHNFKGLLSMVNHGPDTNGGHFSIMMGPARHLDRKHVVFGIVVSGFAVARRVNALAKGHMNNELLNSRLAQIVDAGQLRPGTYVSSPEYQTIVEAEKRRVAWRSAQTEADLARLKALQDDEALPLVYLDVAIRGVFIGRMLIVLFAEDAPWATENFRMLCTGEAGTVPGGQEGEGKPYHFKGAFFYRIIEGFIDQGGLWTNSPLGGLVRDDPGGLRLNHTRMGLLSMANHGPDTNGGHFSIMMGPARHLDGKHVVFGEIVDGHEVAMAINALALGKPNKELKDSQDAQIVDSGELRRGTYCDSSIYREALAEERERLGSAIGGESAALAAVST